MIRLHASAAYPVLARYIILCMAERDDAVCCVLDVQRSALQRRRMSAVSGAPASTQPTCSSNISTDGLVRCRVRGRTHWCYRYPSEGRRFPARHGGVEIPPVDALRSCALDDPQFLAVRIIGKRLRTSNRHEQESVQLSHWMLEHGFGNKCAGLQVARRSGSKVTRHRSRADRNRCRRPYCLSLVHGQRTFLDNRRNYPRVHTLRQCGGANGTSSRCTQNSTHRGCRVSYCSFVAEGREPGWKRSYSSAIFPRSVSARSAHLVVGVAVGIAILTGVPVGIRSPKPARRGPVLYIIRS